MKHEHHGHHAHDDHHQEHDHEHHHQVAEKQVPPPGMLGEGVIYTCPMHPQVRQIGPGNCPICGMALEPEVATLGTGPSPELVDMSRRFWIGLVLSIPVLALEMGGHLTNLHMILGPQTSNWLQMVLATPVVLWAGWPFFERGWKSLVTRHLNMFTLIAMGTGAAWIYSVVATVAPGVFPDTFRAEEGSVAVYFEAARRHHRPGPARAGSGTEGTRTDRRGDPRASRSGTKDGASGSCGWDGRGCRS
jgi:Cu+-exporting ATPase